MYSNPQWSTDGMYLAYKRDIGTPMDDGYQLVYEVWVYNTATQTSQMLAENLRIIGMAWKPGTHLLAYSFAVEEGYFVFTARGQIDSSLAKGIWATDMESGENMELIAPQNGYSLASPQWSRDGRFMAFEEVAHYEGRGNFAIYDFETAEFMAWSAPVGFIDFSPDSQTLAFDTLTYASNGTERIFLRPTLAGEAVQFSPDYELGYAFYPRFSPDGEQIAYLAGLGEPDSSIYTLFVQPTAGGEATSLGEFDFGLYVSWLPDGSGFILAAGQFEARQVLEVSLADGSVKVLVDGDSPSIPQLAP
jgi:Tol biopolymer transport system component